MSCLVILAQEAGLRAAPGKVSALHFGANWRERLGHGVKSSVNPTLLAACRMQDRHRRSGLCSHPHRNLIYITLFLSLPQGDGGFWFQKEERSGSFGALLAVVSQAERSGPVSKREQV